MSAQDSTNRLLKARSMRGVGAQVAFNYDDLRKQCDEYITQVTNQAQSIVAEANAQAGAIREQARAEGYASGQSQGLAQSGQLIETKAAEIAKRKTEEHLKTVLPAMQAAVKELQIEKDRWVTHWETAVVRLSIAIAEKILRHEVHQRPELTVTMVSETLQIVAGHPNIKVHMHPEDIAQLQSCGHEMIQRLSALGDAALDPDERIGRGGCLIETRHGVIDGRIETQLNRIAAELLDRPAA